MNIMKLFKQKDFLNPNLIYNRTVLYFIFIIALTNLFFLFQQNDIFSVAIFFLVGFLTSFFSKNMVVIICICIFFTNILKYGSKAANHASIEGFEEEFEEGNTDIEMTDVSGSKMVAKDMNPEKPESFDQVNTEKKTNTNTMDVLNTEQDNLEKLMQNQDKLLDNMNKYKPLLDTIQKITSNIQVLKNDA